MKLIVDPSQRFAKMRAHTATHLLHAELTKIFSNTKQAWSLVDDDLLRFDFHADRMLTVQELQQIEENINNTIYQSLLVSCNEMSLEDAKKTWAKAFFDEKYWDKVRVVSIACHPEFAVPRWTAVVEGYKLDSSLHSEWRVVSVELCWWTHVTNTKDIWAFVIVNQEAVASGIKRISAYTGPKVLERLRETREILLQVEEKLWVKAENQILDKLEKELREKEEMNSRFESINTKLIIDTLKSWNYPSNEIFDKIINISNNSILKDLQFKDIVFQAKWTFLDLDIIIFNNDWWFAIITSKQDSSAKIITQDLWLKWWWSDTTVQWKDSKVLELFQ